MNKRRELIAKYTWNGKEKQKIAVANPKGSPIERKVINYGEVEDVLYYKLDVLLNHWEKI